MSDAIIVSVDQVCDRLSKSVGREAARAAVELEMDELGLNPREFTMDDALAVLANIAGREGLIAVSARFARSRWILEAARNNLEERSFAPRSRAS